jgi:hypothetical protein
MNEPQSSEKPRLSRRSFLGMAGAGAGVAALEFFTRRKISPLFDLVKLLSEKEVSNYRFYVEKAKGIVDNLANSSSIEPLSSMSVRMQYDTYLGPHAKVTLYASREDEVLRMGLSRNMNEGSKPVSLEELKTAIGESINFPDSNMTFEGVENPTFSVPSTLLEPLVNKLSSVVDGEIYLTSEISEGRRGFLLYLQFTGNQSSTQTHIEKYAINYQFPIITEGIKKMLVVGKSEEYGVDHG